MSTVKNKFALIISILLSNWVFTQESCTFNAYNKKGGHYLFSTYFKSDMQTPLDGECTSYANGQVYEKRVFKNGIIIEEDLYNLDKQLRERYTTDFKKSDSVIGKVVYYHENGKLNQVSIFYRNPEGRRCQKITVYYLNGNKSIEQYLTWKKLSEIDTIYEIKNHPPHTIDSEGYTYEQLPFGTYKQYHENGQLMLSYDQRMEYNTYDADYSKHGAYFLYFDNGNLNSIGFYKNGNKDGAWKYYDYNGNLIKEEFYDNSMGYGTWKGYFEDGKLQSELIYDTASSYPFTPSLKYWNQKGVLIKEVILDNTGKGYRKEWYDDGVQKVYADIIYNSELYGIEKRWYANGQLKEYFNHNKNADTSYASYFENGKPERWKTHTVYGKEQIFEDQTWNASAILINYTKSIQDDSGTDFIYITRNDSGIVQREIIQDNELRTEKYFYSNGTLKQYIAYKNYKLDGPYQFYDSLGTLRTSFNFKDGMRNGKCEQFDEKGKLAYSQFFNMGCVDYLFETSTKSENRKLENLGQNEREKFENYIRSMLYNSYSTNASELVFTQSYIDTLTQNLIWYYDYCKKESNGLITFEFPEKINYEPTFILPKHTFWGIDKNDTTNPYVSQLLQVFQKINWTAPIQWQDKNDHFEGVYKDDNFYANGFYSLNFMWYLQSGFLVFDEVKRDINWNYYYHQQEKGHFSFDRLSDCTFRIHYILGHRSYDWIIYEDGSCDIIPITKTWKDIENEMNEPEYPKMYWD
jgi:antitoxin component YwqK of YwqJK toxin-antitoxin module